MSMTDPMELLGRAALVTGGGSGVGRLAAERLARAGCSVIVVDLDGPAARRTAVRIRRAGGRALAVPDHALCLGDARRVLGRALDVTPRLDVLVNGVAWFPCPWVASLPRSVQPPVMELNLRAALFLAEAATEHMVAAGRGGAVVNLVGCLQGRGESPPGLGPRVVELTRALARRLWRHHVRVNAISVGEPEPGEPSSPPTTWKGALDHVAELVLLLASPAATSVTGSLIVTDGGPASI